MISQEDINAVGDIINSTWGKTSTPTNRNDISMKIHFLDDENMMFKYTTIVNFWGRNAEHIQKNAHEKDAVDITNKYIKKIKNEFKEKTGKTISFNEKERDGFFEEIWINSNVNNRKTAYFRHNTIASFSIS